MFDEKHYTIRQISRMTGIGYHHLYRRVPTWQGVVQMKANKHISWRIPKSVWEREYAKMQQGGPR